MRSFVIDLFKAVAAQLIVLHHLVAYGPVAAAVAVASPLAADWLFDYARMAVQAFIVIGGYLAARSFSGSNRGHPLSPIFKRYLRLVVPFLAALALTSVVAAFVRPWFNDDALPTVPTFGQVFAHIFLLHGVLDYESLSAGAWYVAIDFQLYALFALLVWGSRQAPRWHLAVVIGLTAASLFHFNRHIELDNWALYFFGAYGMGVLAFHISRRSRPLPWLGALIAVAAAALWLDFRGRILLALCIAVALVLLRNVAIDKHGKPAQRIGYLGLNSYSLFLVHFSLCLLGNALFVRMGWHSPAEGISMLLLIWLASNLLADRFFKRVEQPAGKLDWESSLLRLRRSESA
ncbi:MAG: acyltransferase [Rhodocyclaceae bacterium]|nr:acyltransferase [Rhodocyclaceae bacterium]